MLLNSQAAFLAIGLVVGWLILISFFLLRAIGHYKRLTAGTEKGDLSSVLEKILKEQEQQAKRIGGLEKQTEGIEKAATEHIQKIGLVRFNPFPGTGGGQSFTLVILDGKSSGVVLSSLHSRENTRIYAKLIKEGKPIGHELSREEREVITRTNRH